MDLRYQFYLLNGGNINFLHLRVVLNNRLLQLDARGLPVGPFVVSLAGHRDLLRSAHFANVRFS